jgi:hypothetical protein
MSAQRLEANRAIAKRGTGPRTELGKARSKMNAVKHGLSAKALVLEGEDPRQFEALRAALEGDFEPETVVERELVEQLAGSFWRLRRVPCLEAQILQKYADIFDSETPLASAFIDQDDSLGKLSRHQAGLLNAVTRTLNLLHALRVSRGISRLNASDTPGLIESALGREINDVVSPSAEQKSELPKEQT